MNQHGILCSVMHRMFIAIPISEDAKKAALEAQEQLKEMFKYSRITWVDFSQFHITLHFLGDIDDSMLIDLRNRLREALCPDSFKLHLTDVSCFPSPKEPRTIFVEASHHPFSIILRKRIADVLVGMGIDIDARPWKAHITVGRVKTQSEVCVTEKLRVEPVEFIVDRFDLYESQLMPNGPIHTLVESYKLK